MNIAIAQIQPSKGDISSNIDKHIQFIKLAHKLNAAFIFFPELSLTGYEPELAEKLAMHLDDTRLDIFQEISNDKKITIGIGAPTISPTGIRISMILFEFGKPRILYSKQQLHEDEFPYFEKGNEQILIANKIAPAICYESLQMNHADKAAELGAQFYIATVAKSQNGFNKANIHYPQVAQKHKIPVLMSNSIGKCDNFISVGFSSIWNKEGELVATLDNQEEGIMIFDTETQKVIKQII